MRHEQPDPDAWGVELRYRDTDEQWHDAPSRTVENVLAAMGAKSHVPPPVSAVVVVREGEDVPARMGGWSITLEGGGTVIEGEGAYPSDLPLGYHELQRDGGETTRLIVAPAACPDVAGVTSWGWALQLYSLRSKRSWGMGDLGDLAAFGRLASADGAGLVVLNPLHASLPGTPQQPSPYFPSSREFRNPLYLHVEDIPGANRVEVDLASLAHQAHALNHDRRIDRDAVWRLKEDALDRIWRHTVTGPDFERYLTEQGAALEGYATFCVISEQHGRPWSEWPSDLRHPGSASVQRFATAHHERVRFHQWLQWLLDVQLSAAQESVGVVQDLAIGVDPSGADAWLWQDVLALDMRVGAPPDVFNQRGQDWGLPPFDPWRLREAAYEPFIRTVRAGLRDGGGLRIDHVMGLFRLYWIPEGADATQGTYVRYMWDELLAIVALESHRANAHVVGEDLGTVEPYMRDELKKRNVMSYKLVWFEEEPPVAFSELALAAVTTHDLPTVAGLWAGSDLRRQYELNMRPNVEATEEIKTRLASYLGVDEGFSVDGVVQRTHELLAQAPSAWVTATVEDALGVEERPNYPGTTDEYPNWSVALPKKLEEFPADGGFRGICAAFGTERGSPHDSLDESS